MGSNISCCKKKLKNNTKAIDVQSNEINNNDSLERSDIKNTSNIENKNILQENMNAIKI
mgnify:CR=1 FL=1